MSSKDLFQCLHRRSDIAIQKHDVFFTAYAIPISSSVTSIAFCFIFMGHRGLRRVSRAAVRVVGVAVRADVQLCARTSAVRVVGVAVKYR